MRELFLALDDGLGRTPPMGWRSWNCWGLEVTDAKMRAAVDALSNRSTPTGVSLADLGYASVGLDDGWQVRRGQPIGAVDAVGRTSERLVPY